MCSCGAVVEPDRTEPGLWLAISGTLREDATMPRAPPLDVVASARDTPKYECHSSQALPER
eukprot:26241-Eustigmatos_ZCMA.PRE.1